MIDPEPCGAVMATCQSDAGHPGAHWHPRVTEEPGVVPLRPPWTEADIPVATHEPSEVSADD